MNSIGVQEAMRAVLAHHLAGRLAEAERIYRQVLIEDPKHADALHRLGVLACQAGYPDVAIDMIGRAIEVNPLVGEYHSNLGNALKDTGYLDEAIAAFNRARSMNPESAEVYYGLGNALKAKGQIDEAVMAYQQAIHFNPGMASAHRNLANTLFAQSRYDEAVAAYNRAIQCEPDVAGAHCNLGNALHAQGRLDEAIAAYNRAIQLNPKLDAAYYGLGNAFKMKGQFDDAVSYYRQAIRLRPNVAEIYNELGDALGALVRLDDAIVAYEEAIRLKPDLAASYSSLGFVFAEQGRLNDALACYRKAVELKPSFHQAASDLVFYSNFHAPYDAQTILAEHRWWNARFAEPLADSVQPHKNERSPARRLRLGYVSPNFRRHATGHCIAPIIREHDHHQFEVFCYSDVVRPDDLTRRLQGQSDVWRNVAGQTDEEVARLIRADGIDVLVDLTLHLGGNRLLVFARKPAPVQATFGYPGTTGLTTMDYRLTDGYLDPPGLTESDYTERSTRLPHSLWCFEPQEEAPSVTEAPVCTKDFVTFGCLNSFTKVTGPVLELWIRILQRLPTSRLLILSPPGSHRAVVASLFRDARVAPDRVEFAPRLPLRDYYRRYGNLDLSLDPFPYGGHTSALDSLWMGVPVITLAGQTVMGRAGVSLLTNLGLSQLIAATPEEYVDIAVEWARDVPRLSALRRSLRARMLASPLMDVKQFTHDLESAFRQMWVTWCSR